MEENILRIGRLYFFLFLGFFISFNSCNSDDDDEIDNVVVQTWLEKYDGTKWVDGDDWLYIRIVNNITIISESWHRDGDCFIYYVADEDVEFDIIENSENKLVFEVVGDVFQRNTYTVSGNTLTWVIEVEFWEEPETVTFQKSNVDVDDFTLCDR